MVSASKISRQRHAKKRQQEQMQNLAAGAAAQPAHVPTDEPQQIGSGGGMFSTTVRRGTAKPSATANPPTDAPQQVGSGDGMFSTTVRKGTAKPASAAAHQASVAKPPSDAPQQVGRDGGMFTTTVRRGSATKTKSTPQDPNGQLIGGSGGMFETRVISAGAESVTNKTGAGPGVTQKIVPGGHRNTAVQTVVLPGSVSRGNPTVVIRKTPDPSTVPQNYGAGHLVAPQVPPQAATVQTPTTQNLQPQPQQRIQAPPPAPQARVGQADVTVYLNCFERPEFFRRQLQALRAQSVQPAHVVTLVNPGSVNQDERALSGAQVMMVRTNVNLGPWFRFTMALEAPTKYVCILDDDTLPGPRWLEAAIQRLEAEESALEHSGDVGGLCVAATGQVYRSDSAADHYSVGPHSPREEELAVDVGGQGWVLRKDMLLAAAALPRQGNGRLGWALHLAAALQLRDVLTIVLPYDPHNKEAWGMSEAPSKERSATEAIDREAAQGVGTNVAGLRADIYAGYRTLGWVPQVVETVNENATPV